MGWCCRAGAGQEGFARSCHLTHEIPLSFRRTETTLEGHPTLRPPRNRKNLSCQGMRDRTKRGYFLQHLCFGSNVQVRRPVLKNIENSLPDSKKWTAKYHLHRWNRFDRRRKIFLRERSIEKSQNWVADSDARGRQRLQGCTCFGCYQSSLGFGSRCSS